MVRVFRHHVPVGTVVQLAADACVLFGALLLAFSIQHGPYGVDVSGSAFGPAVAFAAVAIGLNAALGLYRRDESATFGVSVGRLLVAVAIGTPIAYLLFGLFPRGQALQSVVGYAVLYTLAGLILLRQAAFTLRRTNFGAKRVLIVGTGPEAMGVEQQLRSMGHPKFRVVGFFAADGGEPEAATGVRVYAPSSSIRDVVRSQRVDEVIVAVREQRGGVLPLRELLECRINGVPILDLAGFYERVRGEVPIDSLKASWLIYGQGFAQDWLRNFVKRAFDLIAALVLLSLALPVMLLTAVAIRFESHGPVFYRQQRVGRGGNLFDVIKFRSMRTDAEKDGVARWAQARDPRVTRVGAFIRKMRIDELPQLINVLSGDMSLVGPRPERPVFVDQLKQQIRFYDIRHSVKPGVTGWAQVRYTYGASVEDAVRKLQFDIYYVKNHSLFLDLLILVETVRVVLFREGAH
jgi:sugar transferase (PEP-CTERM system associated)